MTRAFFAFAFILLVDTPVLEAQSANFIAQGHYYKAKELFEQRKYGDAMRYIANSKQSLNGTNYQLQNLHIVSLVNVRDFVAARREMDTYFRILDRESEAKGFTRIVERLTDDETKALSKLMIDIMEKASGNNRELNVQTLRELMAEAVGHPRRIANGGQVQPFYITREAVDIAADEVTIAFTRQSHPEGRGGRISMMSSVTGRFVYFDEVPCGLIRDAQTYRFRLSDIVGVQRLTETVQNDVLGIVEVRLRGNTARWSSNVYGPDKTITAAVGSEGSFRERDVGKCAGVRKAGSTSETVNTVSFPYLKGNPAAFNEIKRILESLRGG